MEDYSTDLPIPDKFEEEARKVLEFLQERLGFKLWMLTRTEGEDWIPVTVVDDEYGIKPGDTFQWAHSYCSRMVRGLGPYIAPDATRVPEYVNAEINKQAKIKAYVGTPVNLSDGRMFGTLCAIDPEKQNKRIQEDLPVVQMAAQMLGRLLDEMNERLNATRAAEKAQAESMLDPLSGLLNRRGFLMAFENERERSLHLRSPISMVAFDLDGLKQVNDSKGHEAGDQYIRDASDAIRSILGMFDLAGRLGGDEFGILLADCSVVRVQTIVERLRDKLDERNVDASIGYTTVAAGADLVKALKDANDMMYLEKRERRAA